MANVKVLTIQDISCVGQCSLTVALPIISACGIETCPVPSAVLSTHTGGFSGYTFRDLTDDMPLIRDHWVKEGIKFDAIYTGYLGSTRQIDIVKTFFETCAAENCVKIVDPAMADNGKLYYGFDMAFVEQMKSLCAVADYVVPNITEASMLTGLEYKTEYDEAYVKALAKALCDMGARAVVLTGVSYDNDTTGVVVYENGEMKYYKHVKMAKGCHGTGDIYASAFVGAMMRGKDAYDSARIAADFTVDCIKNTQGDPDHWYGARFEPSLAKLIASL
ncbi:MAG: pyridoxamine kinase [Clostridia bacterium]|nr:pyridoxamine kinase [Clostridia bacterium]